MFRTSIVRTMVGVFLTAGLLGIPTTGWSQMPTPGTRPEGEPFDPSKSFEMQQAPAAGVAIRAGRVFDVKSGTNLQNQVIIIKGERIVDVGPAASVQIPAGARVVDLSRATVLPGFIDHHVHSFGGEANEGLRILAAQNRV